MEPWGQANSALEAEGHLVFIFLPVAPRLARFE
jgi:hypothetical protein